MNQMHKTRLARLLLGLCAALPAPALQAQGIPVIDAANNVARAMEHAQSLAKFIEQITVMKNQLETTMRQYQAMTGSRNLGDILNNPLIRDQLPLDAYLVLKNAERGNYEAVAKASARILNEEALTGNHEADKQAVQTRGEQLAIRSKALMEQLQKATTDRMGQLSQLQQQINLATDPKAIQDLQARMLVEQGNIQADKMRADLLIQQLEAEQELLTQQAEKIADTSFSVDAIRAPLPGR